MSNATALRATPATLASGRAIARRTRGRAHGPITRLMSPSDEFGEMLKPFVFLDLFDSDGHAFPGTNLHPHSGITTVTHVLEGAVRYEDTTGARGVLPAGGVEWFKAAGGAWHGGGIDEGRRTRGFQLWLALPAARQHDPVESIYQAPEDVVRQGPARVLVGAYGEARSMLRADSPLTYLAVHLNAGESWRYQPPAGHDVAWIAVGAGRIVATQTLEAGDLAAFEPSSEAIDVYAETDSEFMLGSAVHHPHDLVLGYYSVHTSPAALERGERQIADIGARLRREGRL
jgi:redox-sensitive bicupin YhaK (pirin superfamily)